MLKTNCFVNLTYFVFSIMWGLNRYSLIKTFKWFFFKDRIKGVIFALWQLEYSVCPLEWPDSVACPLAKTRFIEIGCFETKELSVGILENCLVDLSIILLKEPLMAFVKHVNSECSLYMVFNHLNKVLFEDHKTLLFSF